MAEAKPKSRTKTRKSAAAGASLKKASGKKVAAKKVENQIVANERAKKKNVQGDKKKQISDSGKLVAQRNTQKGSKKFPFARGDYVVYPTHGVGKVTGLEKREVAGFNLQLFVISFDAEKMTLRVPVDKVLDSGLRKISTKDKMQAVMATLRGRARSKRTMWSRRAQEYEAKINSGEPVAIAEVVRDLYRAEGQPEQSYSERQMYERALERLVHEFALVEKLDVEAATNKLERLIDD